MRKSRIKLKDCTAVYHCIARIVGGERLLGDLEKERFRQMLWEQAEFSGVEIVTYCLMSNHVHVLVRVPDGPKVTDAELVRRMTRFYGRKSVVVQNIGAQFEKDGYVSKDVRESFTARMGDLSVFMKELKHRFTKWYNKQYGRFGTLWAERFKSVLVEDSIEAVGVVARYIDLNPVRAGIVEDPKDYRFCGYAEAAAGSRKARAGIVSFHEASRWLQAGLEYRDSLFVESESANRSDKVVLDRDRIRKELARGKNLPLAVVLRLRVRYFSDGAVLGSRNFVNEMFGRFRDRFGEKRVSGGRPIRGLGSALSGMVAARDLRVGVFS